VFVSFLCLNFFSHFVDEILFLSNALAKIRIHDFFLYFFYLYFAKIYGPPEILQNYTSAAVTHGGRGPTAARHGGMGRGPLARAHTVVGHGVRTLPPCRTAVGAYRQAAAWPPGRIFFLVNFNF
jgi:hypothetical protein